MKTKVHTIITSDDSTLTIQKVKCTIDNGYTVTQCEDEICIHIDMNDDENESFSLLTKENAIILAEKILTLANKINRVDNQ